PSELVQPEMKPVVVWLGLKHLVTPVRLLERGVRHVGRWPHVRRAWGFGPLRSRRRPVVMREEVVGVVVEPAQLGTLCMSWRTAAEPNGQGENGSAEQLTNAAHR